MTAPTALDDLRPRLRGPLLLPGDPGYDAARAVWNAMIDRRPAAVARCLGAADVAACVRWAGETGATLTVRGGGHSVAGLAVADDALLLDMSLMKGVWVDPERRIARAQAGCLLGDVDRETQLHGLAAVLGFVSNTGIAGLTLGGGFGYLTRRFGWTSDTLRAVELVTADGAVVRATDDSHPELLWGLRGGGGNFGVATGFEYELHPVGPTIIGGLLAWPWKDAAGVLETFAEATAGAPPEQAVGAILRKAPPAPWLPPEIHGQPIAALVALDTGPKADAAERSRRLRRIGAPAGDVLDRRPYVGHQSILDATQPAGRRYYWKSEYLPGFEPALLDKAAEWAERTPSPHSAVILFPLDGAIADRPEDFSAMGNRDAKGIVNIAASWEDPADDDANIAWARAAWEDLRAFSTGGTYVNFQSADEGDDRTRAAYGANWERLVALKSRWDPGNLFRVNKNIAPA